MVADLPAISWVVLEATESKELGLLLLLLREFEDPPPEGSITGRVG